MMMKKIIFLFVLLPLFSCEKEETAVDQDHVLQEEFYDLVEGYYDLRVATTDIPLDLNHDGVSHTNIYKEIIYCPGLSLNLNSYSCGFSHTSTYSNVIFDIPTSDYIGSGAGISTCLSDAELAYYFKVNAKTREVMLVQSDHWDDFAATFHAEILDLHWENDRAYFKIRKRFRISSTETKWVMLFLEYEKVLEEY